MIYILLLPKLIWRKIWIAEKYLNFKTVNCDREVFADEEKDIFLLIDTAPTFSNCSINENSFVVL